MPILLRSKTRNVFQFHIDRYIPPFQLFIQNWSSDKCANKSTDLISVLSGAVSELWDKRTFVKKMFYLPYVDVANQSLAHNFGNNS